MRYSRGFFLLLLAAALVVAGCSSDAGPTIPGAVPNGPAASDGGESHHLLGLYAFICDPDAGSVDVIPLRDAGMHLNALRLLEPPSLVYLTLESPPIIKGGVLDVDVGLRNPLLGADHFTGFDVRGIFISHGSVSGFIDPEIVLAGQGDTRLLNADGYTRWWNPAEFPHGNTIFTYADGMLGTPAYLADYNCTINGYKYFADGLTEYDPLTVLDPADRGYFGAGQKNIRHYKISLAGGLIFNYAVDACWRYPTGSPPFDVPDDFPVKANCPEAYDLTITELENTLYYVASDGAGGGELHLLLDVWDHFDSQLNRVYAESLAGLPLTGALTPVEVTSYYSRYELAFSGEHLTRNGDAELWIIVACEASGYMGILPGRPISTYFRHSFYIDPDGPIGWAKSWGGLEMDAGRSVAVDSSGYVYVSGEYNKTVDFDPGLGVELRTSNGWQDAFISKFDKYGEFQWAGAWGSGDSTGDRGSSVAVSGSGDVYVTGFFGATVDFDPGDGVVNRSSNGARDVFLSRFNSDGALQWVLSWGGTASDEGTGVALDSSGNIYVTGTFKNTVDFDPGLLITEYTSQGQEDIFLSKFNPAGLFQWAVAWGGPSMDESLGLDIDGLGNIYIAGQFEDTADFDPGPGIDNHTSAGLVDAFLSKINSSTEFQWARTWGGSLEDIGHGIAVDSLGNAYVSGEFSDSVDFDPGVGSTVHTSQGLMDAFLSKFNTGGDFQWAHAWGAGNLDKAMGVAFDGSSYLYVTGLFEGLVDFDPGPGVNQQQASWFEDVYLSKFDTGGNLLWVRVWGGHDQDFGTAVFADGTSHSYVTGHFASAVADFDPGPGSCTLGSKGSFDAFLSKFPPNGNWD